MFFKWQKLERRPGGSAPESLPQPPPVAEAFASTKFVPSGGPNNFRVTLWSTVRNAKRTDGGIGLNDGQKE